MTTTIMLKAKDAFQRWYLGTGPPANTAIELFFCLWISLRSFLINFTSP